MAYGKVDARLLLSDNSDHSNPWGDTRRLAATTSSDTTKALEFVFGSTDSTILEAGEMTSVEAVMVINEDASTQVSLGYTDTAAVGQIQDVLAGGALIVMNVDPSVDITLGTKTGTARCIVTILGTA